MSSYEDILNTLILSAVLSMFKVLVKLKLYSFACINMSKILYCGEFGFGPMNSCNECKEFSQPRINLSFNNLLIFK